jgi:hypothetical protein
VNAVRLGIWWPSAPLAWSPPLRRAPIPYWLLSGAQQVLEGNTSRLEEFEGHGAGQPLLTPPEQPGMSPVDAQLMRQVGWPLHSVLFEQCFQGHSPIIAQGL